MAINDNFVSVDKSAFLEKLQYCKIVAENLILQAKVISIPLVSLTPKNPYIVLKNINTHLQLRVVVHAYNSSAGQGGVLKQEVCEFKANLGYIVRPFLKKSQNTHLKTSADKM
jgi:hypothetical protein